MNRKKYFAQRGRDKKIKYELKRKFIDLLGGKCVDCGYSGHLAALDFDHITPSEKSNDISYLLTSGGMDSLIEEVLKCEVRCANCHRIKTHPEATD